MHLRLKIHLLGWQPGWSWRLWHSCRVGCFESIQLCRDVSWQRELIKQLHQCHSLLLQLLACCLSLHAQSICSGQTRRCAPAKPLKQACSGNICLQRIWPGGNSYCWGHHDMTRPMPYLATSTPAGLCAIIDAEAFGHAPRKVSELVWLFAVSRA